MRLNILIKKILYYWLKTSKKHSSYELSTFELRNNTFHSLERPSEGASAASDWARESVWPCKESEGASAASDWARDKFLEFNYVSITFISVIPFERASRSFLNRFLFFASRSSQSLLFGTTPFHFLVTFNENTTKLEGFAVFSPSGTMFLLLFWCVSFVLLQNR